MNPLYDWKAQAEGRTYLLLAEKTGYGVNLRDAQDHIYAWDDNRERAVATALQDWRLR